MTLFAIALFGLLIGSFLNVCIHRIPRGQEYTYSDEEFDRLGGEIPPPPPFNDPARSHCPHCKRQLLWRHNIPVFSWLFLRGKCAFCNAKISPRYPFVELLTGGAALVSYYHYGLTPTGAVVFLFCAALIVITFIDYDYFIIPDVISLPGIAAGIGVAAANQYWGRVFAPPVSQSLTEAFVGMLLGGGFLWIVSVGYLKLRKQEGLGLGDVKLLTMTGAFFGGQASIYTIFIGSLIGSVVGIALVLFFGRKMNQHLPFGPYLAFGTVAYLFVDGARVQRLFDGVLGMF